MALKQNYIDALRAFGIQDEEMVTWTIAQMAEKLSELRKNAEKEAMPDKPKDLKTIEITRSYSRKVGIPGKQYENEDFFSSRRAEIQEGNDLRQISNWLAYECTVDVNSQIEGNLNKKDQVPF